jgi:hypothetical protein
MSIWTSTRTLETHFKFAWFITTITILIVPIITFVVIIVKCPFTTYFCAFPRLTYWTSKSRFNLALIWTSISYIWIHTISIWILTVLLSHYTTPAHLYTPLPSLALAPTLYLTLYAALWLLITLEPALIPPIAYLLARTPIAVAHTPVPLFHLARWTAPVPALAIAVVALMRASNVESVSTTFLAKGLISIIGTDIAFFNLALRGTAVSVRKVAVITLLQKVKYTVPADQAQGGI